MSWQTVGTRFSYYYYKKKPMLSIAHILKVVGIIIGYSAMMAQGRQNIPGTKPRHLVLKGLTEGGCRTGILCEGNSPS